MGDPAEPDQGRVYTEFLASELAHERDRRGSFQSRASSLSGFGTGAVGLAAAGVALVFGADHEVAAWSAVLLLVTLVAFLVSTGLAVVVFAVGQRYKVMGAAGASHMLGVGWNEPEELARRAAATLTAMTLVTLRTGNNRSATLLLIAGWLQVGGLASLIGAVAVEFARMVA